MKIAVCVHLYHIDMLDSIRSYLTNLEHEYDLYIGLTKNYPQSFLHNLKQTNKNTNIVFVENIGMDVGGFLQIYKTIRESYDLILKIHTKKGLGSPTRPSIHLSRHGLESANHRGQVWFNGLMHGVLGSKERVDRIIDNFENNPDCGMVGAKKNNNFAVNLSCMNEIFSWVNLKTNTDGHFFVGGTIFWIKNDILKKYLTDDVIDKILEISPPGYVHEPSINHAMERIFGSLVYVENKQIYIL